MTQSYSQKHIPIFTLVKTLETVLKPLTGRKTSSLVAILHLFLGEYAPDISPKMSLVYPQNLRFSSPAGVLKQFLTIRLPKRQIIKITH
jgi:hypothetical protein